MCDPNPEASWEGLEEHKEQGWVPLIAVLSQMRIVDGKPQFDINHLHYAWSISTEMVIFLAMSLIQNVQQQDREDQFNAEHRN